MVAADRGSSKKRKRVAGLDKQGSNTSDASLILLPEASLAGFSGEQVSHERGRKGRQAAAFTKGQVRSRSRSSPDKSSRRLRSQSSNMGCGRKAENSRSLPAKNKCRKQSASELATVPKAAKAACTRKAGSPKDTQAEAARQGKALQVGAQTHSECQSPDQPSSQIFQGCRHAHQLFLTEACT